MVTVADIAKAAFDGVSADITDAVLSASLSDGTTSYAGRIVLAGEKAANGFPLSTAKDRVQDAVLEGFSVVAASGWTVVADGVTYFITGVRDIVASGGVVMARVIASQDMLWQTVTFQEKTRTGDGMGGVDDAWSDIATVSAGVIYTGGNESFGTMRVAAMASMQLVVQHIDGLTAENRVKIGSDIYNLTFVDDFERRGYWDVLSIESGP